MGGTRVPARGHGLGAGAILRDHMIKTISPVDGRVYVERAGASAAEIDATLQHARAAQLHGRKVPMAERAALMECFCAAFEARAAEIATELSWQMGRPIRYAPNEGRGTV